MTSVTPFLLVKGSTMDKALASVHKIEAYIDNVSEYVEHISQSTDVITHNSAVTAYYSKKKTDTYGHDEYDAEVIAEKIVKGQLQSPSTAKFCEHKEYTISGSGNTFTVKFTFTSSERYTTDSCMIK